MRDNKGRWLHIARHFGTCDNPYCTAYYQRSSIEISQEGVQALLDALELKRPQLVEDTSA